MEQLPQSATELLRHKPAYGHVVTQDEDLSPQVSMTWVDEADGYLLINTAEGRRKVRNMRARPQVVISIQDPDHAQDYLLVHGHVERIDSAGAVAHIDALARRYVGTDGYPWHKTGETRLIVRIAPDRISGQGPWGRQQPGHVLK